MKTDLEKHTFFGKKEKKSILDNNSGKIGKNIGNFSIYINSHQILAGKKDCLRIEKEKK